MIGQTIEAKCLVSKGALFWFLCAALLGIAALATWNLHFLFGALMPLAMALAFWHARPADVVVTLEEAGIVFFHSRQTIRYDSIKAVFVGDRLLHRNTANIVAGPIAVLHQEGQLVFPDRMNVSSVDLAKFLIDRSPPPKQMEVHPSLVEFANEQLAKFGSEKVTALSQRPSAYQLPNRTTLATLGKSWLLCSICWIVLAVILMSKNDKAAGSYSVWLGFGILCSLLGALFWFLRRSGTSQRQLNTKVHGPASIVISAGGLGLAQGELQGKLRWEEITGIKNGATGGSSMKAGLRLSIAGGEIVIQDVYDRSLAELESLIRANTRLS